MCSNETVRFAQKQAAIESDGAEGTCAKAYSLKLILEGLPKILSNGQQGSWKATHYHKRQWKTKVIVAIGANRPPSPLAKAKVIFTRHSSRAPDYDGLVSSCKALLDGLKEAHVIVDDSMDVVTSEYHWIKAKPRQGKVTIEIYEVTECQAPKE